MDEFESWIEGQQWILTEEEKSRVRAAFLAGRLSGLVEAPLVFHAFISQAQQEINKMVKK